MQVRSVVAATGILLFGISVSAPASPIGVNSGWHAFCFLGSGTPATQPVSDACPGVNPWNPITFDAGSATTVMITDAYFNGDTFRVSVDYGIPDFTPAVPLDTAYQTDPDLAFADSRFSHAEIAVAAGSHTVNIFAYTSPHGGGMAFFELVGDPIPEPASILLAGTCLLGLGLTRRFLKSS